MGAFLSVIGMYNYDDSIFDNFSVPLGMDKSVAVNKILFDNAELGLVYTDPDIFPMLVKNWSDVNARSWEMMLQALTEEYNPIHNYDRTEEWTDERTGEFQSTADRDVAGFNENSTLVKSNKITNDGETGDTLEHSGRMFGNIGVTTTQHMIEEELELRKHYNIYQEISDSFKRNFCIMVY